MRHWCSSGTENSESEAGETEDIKAVR